MSEVLLDCQDGVATVTLNRPERLNAYTPRMAEELKQAISQAANGPDVRVIVITGAGRGFCAGMDMSVLTEQAATGKADEQAGAAGIDKAFDSGLGPSLEGYFDDPERFSYFFRTKKPIIAAINGPAAGYGLVMAVYADVRFASADAVFTTSFAQRGLIAEHGLSWLLPRLIGQANALDILLSARKVTAPEAFHMGLVNKVFPEGELLAGVRDYAALLANRASPRSMAVIKAQVLRANFQTFTEALQVADAEMTKSLTTADFKEGVAHFLERRAPAFLGI